MGCFHEILSVTVCVCTHMHVVLALWQSRAPGRKNEYFCNYYPYPPIITPGLPTARVSQIEIVSVQFIN